MSRGTQVGLTYFGTALSTNPFSEKALETTLTLSVWTLFVFLVSTTTFLLFFCYVFLGSLLAEFVFRCLFLLFIC